MGVRKVNRTVQEGYRAPICITEMSEDATETDRKLVQWQLEETPLGMDLVLPPAEKPAMPVRTALGTLSLLWGRCRFPFAAGFMPRWRRTASVTDRADEVTVAGGQVSLEDGAVVQRRKNWLGGEERLHIPLGAVTSIGVRKVYSLGTLIFGLLLTAASVGVIWFVGLQMGLFVAALGVAVLIVAALWTSDALVVASPTGQIRAHHDGVGSEVESFVAMVLSEIE